MANPPIKRVEITDAALVVYSDDGSKKFTFPMAFDPALLLAATDDDLRKLAALVVGPAEPAT
ncbi:MAG: hypothetical protein JWP57_4395 [Spirosoma sp.]|nr:hypothetical protein [Spirosoma sp.]